MLTLASNTTAPVGLSLFIDGLLAGSAQQLPSQRSQRVCRGRGVSSPQRGRTLLPACTASVT